jgi:hypothetical protein
MICVIFGDFVSARHPLESRVLGVGVLSLGNFRIWFDLLRTLIPHDLRR